MQITSETTLKDFTNISYEVSGVGYVKQDDHNLVIVDGKIYRFIDPDNENDILKVVEYVGIFQDEFAKLWFARHVSILNCDGILVFEF